MIVTATGLWISLSVSLFTWGSCIQEPALKNKPRYPLKAYLKAPAYLKDYELKFTTRTMDSAFYIFLLSLSNNPF